MSNVLQETQNRGHGTASGQAHVSANAFASHCVTVRKSSTNNTAHAGVSRDMVLAIAPSFVESRLIRTILDLLQGSE